MIKHAIKNSKVESRGDWAEVLSQVLYGYRRRDCGPSPSPFRMMHGINPRMLVSEALEFLIDGGPHYRLVDMFGESCVLAETAPRVPFHEHAHCYAY